MNKRVYKGSSSNFVGICLVVAQIMLVGALFFRQITVNSAASISTESPRVMAAQSIRFEKVNGISDPNQILDKVNLLRSQNGLNQLVPDAKLSKVAQTRANDMSKQKYYAHKNPQGLYYYDYLAGTGFDTREYSCENLDLQFIDSIDKFVDDWQNSDKGHRECMLNNGVNSAGYAVTSLNDLPGGQIAYIVVAIHGESSNN